MERSITAIVKPTHRCNLRCKYCYLEDSAEQGEMSPSTIETLVEGFNEASDLKQIHFIWHGGEPFLMDLEFYEDVVRIQKKYPNMQFSNSVQTNSTLISDRILDFCEENNFHIGTSLDGPEAIHNLTRVYPNGRGSFEEVWRGIKMTRERNQDLRNRGIKKYLGGGPIVVLSRKNIDHLDEIYDFLKGNKISFKIGPLIKSGRAKTDYEDLGIGPLEYGEASIRLFDRWFYEKEDGIDIDPIRDMMVSIITETPYGCNFSKSCRERFISIGPNGDVYPCGRFDGVEEYKLGNIHAEKIQEIMDSELHRSMLKRNSETLPGCSDCQHKAICNGGCMHNAYMRRGQLGDKDYYCGSYKMLFSHLKKAINSELSKTDSKCLKGGENGK